MAKQYFIGRLMGGIFLLGVMFLPQTSKAEINWAEDNKFIHSEYSQKISMDFKDAALNDVLKIFSQQSGMNFIAAENITNKKITMFLDNVPVEQALEKILDANGLSYDIQPGSDIFIVKAKTSTNVITRIYPLKNATVSSSKMTTTFTIKDDSGDEDSSSGASSSSASGSGQVEAGLLSAIKAILTAKGKVIEDPRTNSLIITDESSQFPLIEETIARLDVPIPQILIEVEMLDISKLTSDKLGIKLGEQPLLFRGAGSTHYYPWNGNELQNRGLLGEDAEATTFSTGTLTAAGLTAALQFLKTQSDTKNLARPRILTLNNETAQIQISTDEAIGVTQSTTSQTGDTTEEAERTNTGVFLTVTPQANVTTGEITLAITPRVIVARQSTIEVNNVPVKDPEERGVKTFMRVKTGETIILGGLLRGNDNQTVTKYPLLGDIPILGAAFRHKEKTVDERELVIFLTPHILDEKNKDKVSPSSENLQMLSREQDVPPKRLNAVDKELDLIEEKL